MEGQRFTRRLQQRKHLLQRDHCTMVGKYSLTHLQCGSQNLMQSFYCKNLRKVPYLFQVMGCPLMAKSVGNVRTGIVLAWFDVEQNQ